MGSSIEFFAGPADDRALCAEARDSGLHLVPPWLDQLESADVDNPAKGPFWFLSFVPIRDLHPYGDPPVQVSDATDPLIELLRGYYDPPHLVAGRLYWSNDVPALSRQTKPHYTRLARWIRRSWMKRPEDGYFIGPDALQLIAKHGAKTTYLHPGVNIERR